MPERRLSFLNVNVPLKEKNILNHKMLEKKNMCQRCGLEHRWEHRETTLEQRWNTVEHRGTPWNTVEQHWNRGKTIQVSFQSIISKIKNKKITSSLKLTSC
mgnify:CR=1 FL=1